MALSQKHRSSLFSSLAPMVGEEETEALLSQFPATDLDRPATKDFVRGEIIASNDELRRELWVMRDGLQAEMVLMRDGLQDEIGVVAKGLAEVRDDVAGLRVDMTDLRVDMADLRVEMNQRFHSQLVWLVGALFSSLAILLTAMGLLAAYLR